MNYFTDYRNFSPAFLFPVFLSSVLFSYCAYILNSFLKFQFGFIFSWSKPLNSITTTLLTSQVGYAWIRYTDTLQQLGEKNAVYVPAD